MEEQFSRLYAGPLSASAHSILAALRAEYADRLDRSHTYLQRRPVNLYQSQSTWSQTQSIHSLPSRSWARPYSSYTGTQKESDRTTFLASATERDSSPTHATPLPTWMESAEREPALPFFTQRKESPTQAEFSLHLDSPQNEHSFHFQSQPGKHSSVHSPPKEPLFPLSSPRRGSPSSISTLKEPPLTPPSMGTGLLVYPHTVSAPRGAVRRLRMPLSESHTASQFQIQLENGSDQARQVIIPSNHASLENQQRLPRCMQHTRPKINQTVPCKHHLEPESHREENRQQAELNPNSRLYSHLLNPDIGHTESDIGHAGSDNIQTKPDIQTQASSEVHRNTRSDFTDLQTRAEDKDDPSTSSPVISVPQIPNARSRQRGWCLSVMPSREVPESGEQAENIPSPADTARKRELGHLLLPAHKSCVTRAEIESLDFDGQSADPRREENSQMDMVLGPSSDRGGEQDNDVLLPTGDARHMGESVASLRRGFDLGTPSEGHLIQVHAGMEDAQRGSEDMSATLIHDSASHLLDTRPETELTVDVQPLGALPGTDSVESPLVLEKTCQPAPTLSRADTFLSDHQPEREADDWRDHRDQRNSGERKDENDAFEKIVWFDRETCMTEPNHLTTLSDNGTPVAEECQPEPKRQKISLTEGAEEMEVRESPVVVEEPGHQRRLGASNKSLPFRVPPAVQRNPLQQSQPNSQVLAQSSNISCGPKMHLLTPTVKGVFKSPRMASSSFPTCSAPPTPAVDNVTSRSIPPQQPSLFSLRRPIRWEPPHSTQGEPSTQPTATPQSCARPQTSKLAPAHPKTTQPSPQARPKTPCHDLSSPLPRRPPQWGIHQQRPAPKGCPVAATADPSRHSCRKRPCSVTQEPPISHQPVPRATNQKETEAGPERSQTGLVGGAREEAGAVTPPATKSKPSLALTSDPRVSHLGRLSAREREDHLEEARMARALVLTLVLQDGSTQLDTEQKNSPCVCGILILVKRALDLSRPQPTEEEKLLFLRLEQRPVWVKHQPNQNHEQFIRELLLMVLSGQRQVVCYKAKDLLRILLQHYTHTLNWKQLGECEVQDPQIAAWLLDPGDSAACFQELLNKHCSPNAYSTAHNFTLAQAPQKVTQLISGLNHLYKLMVELRLKLQTKGLWQLYSQMETQMIPVLAGFTLSLPLRLKHWTLKHEVP